MAIAVGSVAFIGTEFMPKLDEGSILITTRKLPGIGLTESVNVSKAIEKTVLSFPEVRSVVTKLGRPDLATEAWASTKPTSTSCSSRARNGRQLRPKRTLYSAMSARLEEIPGVEYNFTQPMAMRLDEVVSGIKADVAVKIFGEDSAVLEQLAGQALKILSSVPGAADTQAEVLSGVPELRVQIDRGALARYGLNVTDVQDLVDSATGGQRVSEMVEGQRRFPIAVRLPERYRDDLDAMGELTAGIPVARTGPPLNQVASSGSSADLKSCPRENAQRRIIVQANVRGRDLGSFVKEAQQNIGANLTIPAGL